MVKRHLKPRLNTSIHGPAKAGIENKNDFISWMASTLAQLTVEIIDTDRLSNLSKVA